MGRQSGSETRLQSQKSTCKDLKSKWPKTSHLDLRPLTLRFLSAPAHALKRDRRARNLHIRTLVAMA
ncbi:hypothetical protein FEI14_01965 [Lacticaseibacillus zeae]|uniref:Uncharacterized protein n=1 Tax=Lacticaseibacillus zeae TaxID=57037 RepID=A0A5R8M2U2_LACZE|nr:hypothetical protein FEI14_01965 [Lacticaseibacillus zeae]